MRAAATCTERSLKRRLIGRWPSLRPRPSPDVQRLLTEEPPGRCKAEIGAHEERMFWKTALHAVRQELADDLLRREAGEGGRFDEALLRDRHAVVDEVPVRPTDELDVRLENEHPAAGSQEPMRDAQLLDHALGRIEVLEVV